MKIQATLEKRDLEELVAQFCPLHVVVGDEGNVLFLFPRDVELIAGEGLKLTVSAEIHWPILGLSIPLYVRACTLEVRPAVRRAPGRQRLAFSFRMQELDVELFPAVVDRNVAERINRALQDQEKELSWSFTRTLSHVFELPPSLASARAIDLLAVGGDVCVTAEAVVLTASFQAGVVARPQGGAPRAELPRPDAPLAPVSRGEASLQRVSAPAPPPWAVAVLLAAVAAVSAGVWWRASLRRRGVRSHPWRALAPA